MTPDQQVTYDRFASRRAAKPLPKGMRYLTLDDVWQQGDEYDGRGDDSPWWAVGSEYTSVRAGNPVTEQVLCYTPRGLVERSPRKGAGEVPPVTIGLIYVIRNMEDYLSMSLSPWVAARAANLGGCDYVICAVCVPFKGFPNEEPPDSTLAQLEEALAEDRIDHLIAGNEPMAETEARGAALRWLVEGYAAEVVWQIDADERYLEEDILGVVAFLRANPWVQCFRVSLRNLVFDTRHYLAEPFTPMRIHRVCAPGGYLAAGFWDDNNVYYERPWLANDANGAVRDVQLSCLTIPQSAAAPLHYTWLNDDRARQKCAYQTARSWSCSYRWDDARGLCFNEEHFKSAGLPLPEVLELPEKPPLLDSGL